MAGYSTWASVAQGVNNLLGQVNQANKDAEMQSIYGERLKLQQEREANLQSAREMELQKQQAEMEKKNRPITLSSLRNIFPTASDDEFNAMVKAAQGYGYVNQRDYSEPSISAGNLQEFGKQFFTPENGYGLAVMGAQSWQKKADEIDAAIQSGQYTGKDLETLRGQYQQAIAMKEMKVQAQHKFLQDLNAERAKMDEASNRALAAELAASDENLSPGQIGGMAYLDKGVYDKYSKATAPEDAYKVGHIQVFQEGRHKVPKEYIGNGQWRPRPDLGVGEDKPTVINLNNPKDAASMRKEYQGNQIVKDFRQTKAKFDVMDKAFEESKKTGNYVAVDQALVTLYNKMTDPQSVVRESEYVRTPEDMALMDRAKAAMIRVQKGGRLEPNTRQALMTMAGKFRDAYYNQVNDLRNEYAGYARDYNIKPEMVVGRDEFYKPPSGTVSPTTGKTVVERRKSKSGKILVKYSDGSIGEE